jgi:hypothetical protein
MTYMPRYHDYLIFSSFLKRSDFSILFQEDARRAQKNNASAFAIGSFAAANAVAR